MVAQVQADTAQDQQPHWLPGRAGACCKTAHDRQADLTRVQAPAVAAWLLCRKCTHSQGRTEKMVKASWSRGSPNRAATASPLPSGAGDPSMRVSAVTASSRALVGRLMLAICSASWVMTCKVARSGLLNHFASTGAAGTPRWVDPLCTTTVVDALYWLCAL